MKGCNACGGTGKVQAPTFRDPSKWRTARCVYCKGAGELIDADDVLTFVREIAAEPCNLADGPWPHLCADDPHERPSSSWCFPCRARLLVEPRRAAKEPK